jgi:putative flippase GtrA
MQFIRYAFCGGVATLVDMGVFYFMAWKILPALKSDDPVVRRLGLSAPPISEQQRSRRFVINTAVAFVFSNATAYGLNVVWVFSGGRHAWWVEILLFYAVSGLSIAMGTALGWGMIRFLKASTTFSYAGKLVSALLINFVCRKFIVFRG